MESDGTYGFWAVAERDPDRIAVIDPDGSELSFGTLADQARALAAHLHHHGLRRGDVLAVVVGNESVFFEVLLAAFEFGLYLVPVNVHLAPPEVAHMVVDSGAKAVVVAENLVHLVHSVVSAAGIEPECRIVAGAADGFIPLDRVRRGGGALPAASPGAAMMYTSGTTGRPKGVRRPLPVGDPNEVAAEMARLTAKGFGAPLGRGTHLVCGPLYHAGPFVGATTALHVGHTVVLLAKWTPEAFLQAVAAHRVTDTQMVPIMFHRLLSLPEDVRSSHDLSSLVSVFHTGAPCPVHVKAALMEWWGPIIYETYGGTEAAATIATPRRWLQKPGTVGRPIHGVTVHILDTDGHPCPAGTPGTIYIESHRGDRTELFRDKPETRSMRRGNFVTLGDVGYLDEDGYLFLSDREIDMIISGGVNIYPAEVEAVLLACPGITDVAVIGIPDEEWGEQVLALVELADPAADIDAETRIRAFCDGQLARFKQPRRYEFVMTLPRLPNGKVEKRRLRERKWVASGRTI